MHDFSRFRNHTSFTQVFRDQNPRKIQVLQRKKKVVQLKFCVVLAYFHDCFVHFKSYYVPFGSLQRSPIGPQSSGWRTTELSVICIKILHNQYIKSVILFIHSFMKITTGKIRAIAATLILYNIYCLFHFLLSFLGEVQLKWAIR